MPNRVRGADTLHHVRNRDARTCRWHSSSPRAPASPASAAAAASRADSSSPPNKPGAGTKNTDRCRPLTTAQQERCCPSCST